MTALSETVEMLLVRQAAVVAAYELATHSAQAELIAGEALALAGVDPARAALLAAEVSSVRLLVDVAAWRWVEERAALLFDFSADGGSYQRSQLMKNAMEMRQRAEARAVEAGLLVRKMPEVKFDVFCW